MSPGILYLHGFCSSPASWKARLLGAALETRGLGGCFYCPELSPVPEAAIAQAEALIRESRGSLTLIGSSLGGYYATHLSETHGLRAVLINPAVVAPLSLHRYLGTQTNLYTGTTFEFTEEHIRQLRAIEPKTFHPDRYLLMVETGDEVLDYRQAVSRYQGSRQIVLEGGNHSFENFPRMLPQLLEFCGL